MLAVVHDEQGLDVAQSGDDAVEEGLAWFLLADRARPMVGTTRSGWPIGASGTSHTPPS